MFSLRSVSCMFLVTFASAFAAGCTAQVGDDVYTPDEERSEIAPVARDEVRFPLAAGTMVPNADGVATRLTNTMQGVRVRFLDLQANETCDSDSSGEGEFYFDLGINRRNVGRRTDSHWASLHRGEAVTIEASRVFFVEPNESFAVKIDVNEHDDMLNGADDHVGTRTIEYASKDLLSMSPWHTAQIGSGDCEVTVTYTLERVQ